MEAGAGSDPFSTFRDVAQFRHKYALGCALREKMQIIHFVRTAQNNAPVVSESVRKHQSRQALIFLVFSSSLVDRSQRPEPEPASPFGKAN
jgi:hypothetical protein